MIFMGIQGRTKSENGSCLSCVKWLVSFVSLIFVASCATTVKPVPEPIELPQEFRESGESPLEETWWVQFNDPGLEEVIRKALSGNFSLRSTWRRLSQADAQLRIAGSGLWPSLDASGSYEEIWERSANSTGRREITNSEVLSAGLAAEYEVDLWGRIRSEKNAAKLDREATREEVHAAAITLSASVARTWYQIQEHKEQLRLLDAQINTTESIYKVLDTRFRRGASPASDVLQQEQLLESRYEERERALLDLETLEISLAILLGETPSNIDMPEGKGLVDLPPLPETGIPSEVLMNRPDIKSAYYDLQARDQDIATAIAETYPRLSIGASISDSNDEWRNLFDNWVATVVADLVAPILDGGQRRAEVDRVKAVYQEQINNYAQSILEAIGDVETALAAEKRQRLIVESLEKQLDLSRRVGERLRSEYLSGSVEFLRVLDIQESQQALERDIISAQQELIGYRIDLCRALSGGWELEEPKSDGDSPQEQMPLNPIYISLPGDKT